MVTNFGSNVVVADNFVVFNNNTRLDGFTDEQITEIYKYAYSLKNVSVGGSVGVSNQVASGSSVQPTEKVYRDIPKHIDDISYEVTERKIDNKKIYTIGFVKNGRYCSDLKSKINANIKALKDIKTVSVDYTDKDGKTKHFTAWGYEHKATATKAMKSLPTSFDYVEKTSK